MAILFTIIAFIVVFSILVLAHEFGHYLAAKRSGITVEEFGIGFPPKLWGKKVGETLYSINAIPFGGFVRLLGLDGEKGAKKHSKKSFSHRRIRTRAKVMVAGVAMNLFLAWLLITVGFIVGMEPLLGSDDVFPAVDSGVIQLQEGAVVKSVDKGGLAESLGMKPGDVLLKINGSNVSQGGQLSALLKNPVSTYTISSGGKVSEIKFTGGQLKDYLDLVSLNGVKVDPKNVLGVSFYEAFSFPRAKIYSVAKDSNAYKSGLRDGDVLVAVNGQQVYSLSKYRELTDGLSGEATFTVFRDGERKNILVTKETSNKVIVSEVQKDKPAYKKGLMDGDIILSVNGKVVTDASMLISFVFAHKDEVLAFSVQRGDKISLVEIQPEDGKIGVYLSELFSGVDSDMSIYNVEQFTSIVNIKDEQYPVYSAPFYAFGETYRMAKMTGVLFVDFLKQFFGTGELPPTVSGPVGIAQMTGAFAREGFIPLIRFIAILSISLAVLNIFPFPALDGVKLIFLVIEFFAGRKVSPKWENYIHMVGYFLIILLVLAITYKDILRVFV